MQKHVSNFDVCYLLFFQHVIQSIHCYEQLHDEHNEDRDQNTTKRHLENFSSLLLGE